jgi:hypothetical protein
MARRSWHVGGAADATPPLLPLFVGSARRLEHGSSASTTAISAVRSSMAAPPPPQRSRQRARACQLRLHQTTTVISAAASPKNSSAISRAGSAMVCCPFYNASAFASWIAARQAWQSWAVWSSAFVVLQCFLPGCFRVGGKSFIGERGRITISLSGQSAAEH